MKINDWEGTGYIVLDKETGSAGYMISGGLSGGSTSLEDIGYKDSARKFNVSNLLNHWVASSVDGWRSFRDSEICSKPHWAKFHGKKSGIKLHAHIDVGTSLPVKVTETNGRVHDNTVSKGDLFDNTVLVKDRAYTDLKTFDMYKNNKQDFVE